MLAQSRSVERICISDLRSRGVAVVPYPDHSVLKNAVAGVVPLWEKFCALPLDLKRQFPYTKDHKVSGVGYEAPEVGRDPKEDFHLRVSEQEWLLAHAYRIGEPAITDFIESVLCLGEHVMPLVSEFAREVEEDFNVPGFSRYVDMRKDESLFRFLHYLPGSQVGDIIAEPHIDKGGLTAHLFENRSGIEFLTPEGTWEAMSVPSGKTTIIGGMRLQHFLKCEIHAACHRVVATEDTALHGRFSAVCFIDFDGSPYYNKDLFGRLQGFPAGFFYGMPLEDFKRYFIN